MRSGRRASCMTGGYAQPLKPLTYINKPTVDMQRDTISRRKFVASTTGATFGAMILPRHVLGGTGYKAPSDTLNFALVGAGAQGMTDAGELVAEGENLVALVDVRSEE